jgi:hypothetical protein
LILKSLEEAHVVNATLLVEIAHRLGARDFAA